MFGAAAVRNKKKKLAAQAAGAPAQRGPYIKPFGPRFDPSELPYFKYKRALQEAKELQQNISKAKRKAAGKGGKGGKHHHHHHHHRHKRSDGESEEVEEEKEVVKKDVVEEAGDHHHHQRDREREIERKKKKTFGENLKALKQRDDGGGNDDERGGSGFRPKSSSLMGMHHGPRSASVLVAAERLKVSFWEILESGTGAKRFPICGNRVFLATFHVVTFLFWKISVSGRAQLDRSHPGNGMQTATLQRL